MKDRLLICLPQKEKAFQALPFSCFWKFTCCKFNEIQISPKEDIKVTSLFSIIKAKYQIQQYSTEKEKIEYNYLSVVSGQKISLVWSFISFSQGMARTSKQVQIKSKQQQQKKKTPQNMYFVKMLWHRLYADKEPFFFWMLQWGGNREQKWFWATRDNRKWKYLFSFQHTSKLTKFVFTKCLYSHHVTRFAWKFGQNHCPRIKQSPLPVGCIAQTFDFVPGFASAPFCGLNGTRKNFILRRAGQPAVGYWWLEVVILFWKGKPPKSNDVVAS